MKGAWLSEPTEELHVLVMLPDVTHPVLTLHLCLCPAKSVGTGTWETALAQLCGLGESRVGLPTANTVPGWIVMHDRSWLFMEQRPELGTRRAAWPQRCRAPQLVARVMELSSIPWGPALPPCLRKRGGRAGCQERGPAFHTQCVVPWLAQEGEIPSGSGQQEWGLHRLCRPCPAAGGEQPPRDG